MRLHQLPNDSTLLKGLNNGEFMAGDFTHTDGSRYVMIVNKDVIKSRHCAPQFRTPTRRVQMVSPYTGHLTDFTGEQQWLAPGQGVLLKLSI